MADCRAEFNSLRKQVREVLAAQAAFFAARKQGLPATSELDHSKSLERQLRKTLDQYDRRDAEEAQAAQGTLLF